MESAAPQNTVRVSVRCLALAVAAAALMACGGGGGPKVAPPTPGRDAAPDDAGDKDADVIPSTGDDISAWLEGQRVAFDAPALGAAVFDKDGMIASGVTGVRKVGSDIDVTLTDRWHLGGCTTALTATLVAVLVEEETVAWDDTLLELFPEHAGTMKDAFKTVTLDMLLGHRGGFGEFVPAGVWTEVGDTEKLDDQRAIIASEILQRDPDVAPNTAYQFSNVGYIVAAAALEGKTGVSWEDLIRFKVFGPLGMTSCGFGPPAKPPNTVNQPWGHIRDDEDQLAPVAPSALADSPAAENPAGRVHCSLADWGAFARAHLRGAGGEDNLVTAASYAHMHTPLMGQQQAAGWHMGVPDWGGTPGTTYSQFGSNTRNAASLWIAPDLERVFMVTTNYADDAVQMNLADLVKLLATGAYEN